MSSIQASQAISADALATVAGSVPTLKACQDLGGKLGFSAVEMMKYDSFDGMTTHRLLQRWYAREAENATGQVLYDALCDIGLTAIARDHQHLFGKGEQLLSKYICLPLHISCQYMQYNFIIKTTMVQRREKKQG